MNIKIKKRNPVWVVIFSIITLGIYLIYWFVQTKNEMNFLGAKIPSAWLLIVPLANIYLIYRYCDAFSEYVKKDNLGVVWFLVFCACGPVLPIIVQVELNKLVV
jgi:hypothetical protein